MKNKLRLLLFTVLLSFSSFAQTVNPWSETRDSELNQLTNIKDRSFPASSIYYRLDLASLSNVLYATSNSSVIISIPNVNGQMESFQVWEASNFAPELQAAYPRIRAYTGKGITDPTAYLKISLAQNGIQTMVLRTDKTSEFMEPYTTDGLVYALFNKRERSNNDSPFVCLTRDEQDLAASVPNYGRALSDSQTLKKLRLALSCTGEYSIYHGGAAGPSIDASLAAMNATLTRVNGVYETEISVHLDLIANDAAVIYLNPNSDPYSAVVNGSAPSAWNTQLHNTLVSTLGNPAYDMGHLFGASGGGGNSGCIGCVCVDKPAGYVAASGSPESKGCAYTSPNDGKPEGDNFDIDYVAHEMGHQVGASHSFSQKYEGTGVQVEPGSGSTIMGYAGITDWDIQKHTDPYFNYGSLLAIQNSLATKTCPTSISLTNTPPVINAGADYTIPSGTPFMLTAAGSDADGDSISYCWEQNDSGDATTIGDQSFPSATKTVGPNFRSFLPTASPVRYFPALYNILTATGFTPTAPYEALNSFGNGRKLNFVVTARDNTPGGGQTKSDAMAVTVDGAKGPFYITSQGGSQSGTPITWTPGSSQTITWNVASADQIRNPDATFTDHVDILLSTDNGQTYSTVLLANTSNDGTENITVPNITATNCRIMVKPVGNIFFAINRKTFSIGTTPVITTCNVTNTNSTVTNIPSGATSYSTSTLDISNTGLINSVTNVTINVTHTNFGELSFILVSPSGTEIKLISDLCNNSTATSTAIRFTDTGKTIICATPIIGASVLPQEPLYKLIGEPANGTWTLKYLDDTKANTGTLNSWTVNFCTQNAPVLGTEEFALNNLSLYPVPTNDVLNISVPDESNLPTGYTIYNSLGQTILNGKINSMSDLSINTSKLSNGIYFVKIDKESASKTLRFIKN